jgi:Permuted papain-like amidase enzyme, YaeF/YiiX, C92 family
MILTIFLSFLLHCFNIEDAQNNLITKNIPYEKLKDGDIIFQTNIGGQGEAIMLATKSKLTHCGILFQTKNKWYVYEAIQPVQVNTLEDFIERGDGHRYVIKRLKAAYQKNPLPIDKMIGVAKTYLDKDYDLAFNWSDEEMYCSELVYKIYSKGANIELCEKKYLKDYDLTNPVVKAQMKERYGNKIPLDEMMIAPSTIAESEKMELVDER